MEKDGVVMKIYNESKTKQIINPDLNKGYLINDKLFIRTVETQEEIPEEYHYEIVKFYKNGGKDVKKVIDVEYRPRVEQYDEYEDIYVYVPYTEEQYINKLREIRNVECFSIINRGKLWYDTLSEKQLNELRKWYIEWLDVTETLIIPNKPVWLEE
jgi:hypothetical protein